MNILGAHHPDIAASYNNIGSVYSTIGQYDKALEYILKSLNIRKSLFGENHQDVAYCYNNIAGIYFQERNYEKALEYYFKDLDISLKTLGSGHPDVASTLNNIGSTYYGEKEFGKSLEYHIKALCLYDSILGKRHPDVAMSYNNMASSYYATNKMALALEHYQKSIVANYPLYLDSVQIISSNFISGYFDWNELLISSQGKARCFSKKPSGIDNSLELSLRNYKLCDTLINKTRKEITTLTDKINLGEKTNQIYEEAVAVCLELAKEQSDQSKADEYKRQAFYFSEKNKASVLLESLSGQQALQFAGISDSLLANEHDLSIDINFYKKQLADMPDSAKQILYRDRLFSLNRSHDSLISVFENDFPDYYNLKYAESTASVSDIQKLLDPSTAMISYFAGDSAITIFTITKNNIEIEQKSTPKDFLHQIESYRRSLIRISALGQRSYKKHASEFYDLLFPKNISKKIKHLIIVPDHALATIPFETFLTKPVTDKTEMHKLPYLINQYAVSYSYSATLFMKTFPKEQTKKIEMRDLNDWLAFAPVADTSQTGMSVASRELLQRYQNLSSYNVQTRGLRDYFSPLPGTLSEVSTILNLFDQNKAKAKIEVNKNADEKTIKSGLLKDYRILHFATHGMVHNEKPELSCILLASADSSDTQNDGILYNGEIYNLKLNADLVVLSACETGLGKIKKGEGILGLTRALLYAGSKNIIVSLWQVADQSTSDLMIVFYNQLLKKGLSKTDYSGSLRQAKINMIKNKTNAHPFYWSPFILIGK